MRSLVIGCALGAVLFGGCASVRHAVSAESDSSVQAARASRLLEQSRDFLAKAQERLNAAEARLERATQMRDLAVAVSRTRASRRALWRAARSSGELALSDDVPRRGQDEIALARQGRQAAIALSLGRLEEVAQQLTVHRDRCCLDFDGVLGALEGIAHGAKDDDPDTVFYRLEVIAEALYEERAVCLTVEEP